MNVYAPKDQPLQSVGFFWARMHRSAHVVSLTTSSLCVVIKRHKSKTSINTKPLPNLLKLMRGLVTTSKEMERDDKKECHAQHVEKRKGGLITMPFIFANEISEKLAVVGFSANMITYLTQQFHMPLTKAATTLSNFSGTASLAPLLGAFIADAYIGRFWTIVAASLIYQLGMITLTISASFPLFRPPRCDLAHHHQCKEASPWQLAVLYASLLLNALGAGGIRPCVVAFGAEQFDESDPQEKTKMWNFFNWYYFCMGMAMLFAVTVVVYVQDNVGWGWGLGIPTMAMGVSVVSFVAGYPMYRRMEPSGSPFTRLAQVAVAAMRKRKLEMVSDPRELYENDELDKDISILGKLAHTKKLRFLDNAAIVTASDAITVAAKTYPNPWRLSTVHRVEELKSIIRMFPIWAAGILVITASSQQHTFSLQQARTMDRHVSPSSSFLIPPGSMTVFTMLAMLATISLYDRAIIPLARRVTSLDRGLSFLHRMGVGFVISTLATLVAGFVEAKRKRIASKSGLVDLANTVVPISVFWLVPQYALHGVAEAFTSIGHLEFFYDQAPESMRSTATALFWLAIASGSYVSTLLVEVVHKYSAGPDNENWLSDNLNKGKLDYFYWIITGLQALNLVYYIVCARFYTFKPLQLRKREVEDDAVELNNKV